jgi:hypothetical protein
MTVMAVALQVVSASWAWIHDRACPAVLASIPGSFGRCRPVVVASHEPWRWWAPTCVAERWPWPGLTHHACEISTDRASEVVAGVGQVETLVG